MVACRGRSWAPEQRFPVWGLGPPQRGMSIFVQFLGLASVPFYPFSQVLRPAPLKGQESLL